MWESAFLLEMELLTCRFANYWWFRAFKSVFMLLSLKRIPQWLSVLDFFFGGSFSIQWRKLGRKASLVASLSHSNSFNQYSSPEMVIFYLSVMDESSGSFFSSAHFVSLVVIVCGRYSLIMVSRTIVGTSVLRMVPHVSSPPENHQFCWGLLFLLVQTIIYKKIT